jgi:hypothetical protein
MADCRVIRHSQDEAVTLYSMQTAMSWAVQYTVFGDQGGRNCPVTDGTPSRQLFSTIVVFYNIATPKNPSCYKYIY